MEAFQCTYLLMCNSIIHFVIHLNFSDLETKKSFQKKKKKQKKILLEFTIKIIQYFYMQIVLSEINELVGLVQYFWWLFLWNTQNSLSTTRFIIHCIVWFFFAVEYLIFQFPESPSLKYTSDINWLFIRLFYLLSDWPQRIIFTAW